MNSVSHTANPIAYPSLIAVGSLLSRLVSSRSFLLYPFSATMRPSLATALVAGLGWLGLATAHNIQLKAHSRECFHEELHRDDRMTVTFQVGDREFGGSGNLEIDFFVCFLPPTPV